MQKKIIGQCANCGGEVSIPGTYLSVKPPIPRCEDCGAKMESTLPVVEMEDKKTG